MKRTFHKKYFYIPALIILLFIGFWLGKIYGPSSNMLVTNILDNSTGTKNEFVATTTQYVDKKSYQLILKELSLGGGEFDTPQTELFLGSAASTDSDITSLGVVDGTCTINTYINVYEVTSDYISDSDQVIAQVSCWFAGAGSETYLYKKDASSEVYEVISFETGECGDLPAAECSPYGEVRVLQTIK